jgi:transcriptional regulator with XRE-family HTH domain
MSIPKWNSAIHIWHIPCDKRFVVGKERETLAEYVKRVRAGKGYSLAEVSRRSGHQIANSHISRIENGYSTNITSEKLSALAKGLGVPEEEIFAVARGKSLTGTEVMNAEMAHFASRVQKLTPQQKRDFQIAWRMANELLDRLEEEGEGE